MENRGPHLKFVLGQSSTSSLWSYHEENYNKETHGLCWVYEREHAALLCKSTFSAWASPSTELFCQLLVGLPLASLHTPSPVLAIMMDGGDILNYSGSMSSSS